MDLSKKGTLIQWLNKLNPHLVIESLYDLREGEQFIALMKKIKNTSYGVNTKKERFEIIQKFLKDKYDYRLVEQINFDKANELDFAKIAVLMLAAGIEGKPQEEFIEAALSLNEQSQLEIMSILKQTLNLRLDNLFTHKRKISCHDNSWSSDKITIHAKYIDQRDHELWEKNEEIKEKDILLKMLDHELEHERHHCFEMECNLKERNKIISSKDEKIQQLYNQIQDLKKLQDLLDEYHKFKEENDKLGAISAKVKSQSDQLKSLKSENTLLTKENAMVYEELNKMKKMISEKTDIIEKLKEELECFCAKESNWKQTEAKYKSELQQRQTKIVQIQEELSTVGIELALTMKKMVNSVQRLEKEKETQNKISGSEISTLREGAKSYYTQLKSATEEFSIKQPKEQEMLSICENSLFEKEELEHQLEIERRFCENSRNIMKVWSEESQSLKKQLNQLQNHYKDLQKQNDMLNNNYNKTRDQLILKEMECTEFEKKLTEMVAEKLAMENQHVNELEQTEQNLSQEIIDLIKNSDRLEKQNEKTEIKAEQGYQEMKRDLACINDQMKEKQVKTEDEECNEFMRELNQFLGEKDEVKTSKQDVLKIQHTCNQKSKLMEEYINMLQDQFKLKKVKSEEKYNEMNRNLSQHLHEKDEKGKVAKKEDMVKIQSINEEDITKCESPEEQMMLQEQMKENQVKTEKEYNEMKKELIQCLSEELKTSKQQIVKMQNTYRQELTKSKSLEEQIKVLNLNHQNKITSLIQSFQFHISHLKNDHETEFSKIITGFNNHMRKLNEMSKIAYLNYKRMVNQLTKYMIENNKELTDSKQEIVKIQSAYEEKVTKCQSLEKEIEMLKASCEESQCEELQQALFETMSDFEKSLSDKKRLVMQFEHEQITEKKIHEEEINKLNRIIKEVRNECQQLKNSSTDQTNLEILTSQREVEIHENLCCEIESLENELKTTKEENQTIIGKLQDYEMFNLLFTAMCCSFFVVPLYS